MTNVVRGQSQTGYPSIVWDDEPPREDSLYNCITLRDCNTKLKCFNVFDTITHQVKPNRFEMIVTSPTEPGVFKVTGGTITALDNLDGTWTLYSPDPITKFKMDTNKADITAVTVIQAQDLIYIQNTWEYCTNLTTFDTLGLTQALLASNAWNHCSNLTNFNPRGLTSLTNAHGAWSSCGELTSFDASPLTSVTDIYGAWNHCTKLTSFDTSPLTLVIDASTAWQYCEGLTSFDASGLINATRIKMTWDHCLNLTSFDASALTSVVYASYAWSSCAGLICFSRLNSTGFSDIGARTGMLLDCTSLTSPNTAEQTLLQGSTGLDYINPDSCPLIPKRFEMLVTSSVIPSYDFYGVQVDVVDNGDGTYLYSTANAVTKLSSSGKRETEVLVISAFDLVDLSYAWHSCGELTSFDASGLTSATTLNNTWLYCTSLTHFDTKGLTSATNISQAWSNCHKLTTFDTRGLTSATNASGAWEWCMDLVCFNELNSTGFTDKTYMFDFCNSLTAPNASEQTQLQSAAGLAYVNPNPCPAP